MAYYEIKNNNKFLFDNCRLKVVKEIHSTLFDYLKNDFEAYFQNCEDDFVYEIFQNMRPKMFESNRTLIKYNKKVKSLYFLSDGYVFIFNKKNKPVYSIFGKNLFAEYEFITQQNSNYTVKTHPKNTGFGFELKKEDWDRISEKYPLSAKNFLLTVIKRKKKHDKWMDWSLSSLNKNILKNEVVYESNLISTKIEEPKEEKDDDLLFNLININNNKPSLSLSSKKLNKILTTLAEEKDEKYNFQSKEIFTNINNMRYELKQFEQQIIDFKNTLIEHLNIN
jgi:signal-transduction protein with cAMP-binding, CBS, and nucleotidyltransferase domain